MLAIEDWETSDRAKRIVEVSKMTEEKEDNKWCARCQEDFSIAEDVKGRIQMGLLYPLKRFPKRIREHYEVKQGTGDYLCGNCYFDLTEED